MPNIWDMITWSGLMWHRIEKYGGCCEHGNEHSGFVKHREFLDQLRNCCLLQGGPAHGFSVLWYDAVLFGWPPKIWRQQVAPKRLTELHGSQQQLVFVLCVTVRLLRSLPSAPTAHFLTPDKQLENCSIFTGYSTTPALWRFNWAHISLSARRLDASPAFHHPPLQHLSTLIA